MDSALELRGLSVAYNHSPVLHAVDACFAQGDICAIVGPNGAGKSTLIKAIMGLIPRLSGDLVILGQNMHARGIKSQAQANVRARLAYIPQRKSVDWDFPVCVVDVVRMGLSRELGLLGRITKEQHQRVALALEKVGMQDFAQRPIGQLSGGQQQRVFFARALVQRAQIYLLDEPFSGIDAATQKTLVGVLKQLKQEGGSVIIVHHDLATLHEYFDQVLLLRGRVIALGSPQKVLTKENLAQTYGAPIGLEV